MTKKIGINGVVRDMTPEEETAFDASCDITKAKDQLNWNPIINIKAQNFDRIIKWGKRRHGEPEED